MGTKTDIGGIILEIVIQISAEEKDAVVKAIEELNGLGHLKYMSQSMIANSADIKATKVRSVLQELVDEKRIIQYAVTSNRHLQRYYYVVNKDFQPEE
jgi:transcription initiation factor IIE alpha subunit